MWNRFTQSFKESDEEKIVFAPFSSKVLGNQQKRIKPVAFLRDLRKLSLAIQQKEIPRENDSFSHVTQLKCYLLVSKARRLNWVNFWLTQSFQKAFTNWNLNHRKFVCFKRKLPTKLSRTTPKGKTCFKLWFPSLQHNDILLEDFLLRRKYKRGEGEHNPWTSNTAIKLLGQERERGERLSPAGYEDQIP